MHCIVHALHFTLSKMGCAWEAMDILICPFKRTTLVYCVKNGPKKGKVESRGGSLGHYINTDRLVLIVLCFIVFHRCYVFHKFKARNDTSKKCNPLYCGTCSTVVVLNHSISEESL